MLGAVPNTGGAPGSGAASDAGPLIPGAAKALPKGLGLGAADACGGGFRLAAAELALPKAPDDCRATPNEAAALGAVACVLIPPNPREEEDAAAGAAGTEPN
jgi:hypothetical protein